MPELWSTDASPAPWAPPASFSRGFPQSGDLATDTHPTHVGGYWFQAATDEIVNVIQAAGLVFDPANTSQFLMAILILAGRAVADFTATPEAGTAPLNVVFADMTNPVPDTWEWDFGDGASDTTQNPTHTYTDPGTYSVVLTVSLHGHLFSAIKTELVYAVVDGNYEQREDGSVELREDGTFELRE